MNNLSNSPTIYSLSSGGGIAGIAVIRVSGPDAASCIALMCVKSVRPRFASLRQIVHPVSRDLLDEGLVIWMPGPNTFTGEDVVELQVHGGQATIESILAALSQIEGFRQAEPGEFTRRAFQNGRLNLVEIEGLGDLIHAQTEEQRRQALNQSSGAASDVFNQWRSELVSMLGYLEASLDFLEEEDVAKNALTGFRDKLIQLRNDMGKHLNDGRRGEIVRCGVKVVLAGAPNVGKSSLLNYLAQREVAIVSEIPGTTRDVLEVNLDLNGIPVTVSDTAGLRDHSDDKIEQIGMGRTLAESQKADLLIWMVSEQGVKTEKLPVGDAEKILVLNKIDLYGGEILEDFSYDLGVSVKSGEGMEELVDLISSRVHEMFGGKEPALISRERQRLALSECVKSIDLAIQEEENSLELAAEQLRVAASQLGKLVGRVDVEELLDVIFRDFCVGK